MIHKTVKIKSGKWSQCDTVSLRDCLHWSGMMFASYANPIGLIVSDN